MIQSDMVDRLTMDQGVYMESDRTAFQPDVTVAVCVRNGASTISSCLESLLSLEYPLEKLKIIVVDNGSTDNTAEIIHKFPIKIIHEPIAGRGNARNAAIRACQTEFLAFTDADCRAASDWLKQLMGEFQDPMVGAVGGDIITPGEEPLARFYELRRIVSNKEFSGNHRFSPPFLATANTIFRMKALLECGGFSREFIAGEDADVCWRIQSMGYEIKYIPGGRIYHYHRATWKGLLKQSIEYGYGGVHLFHRYHRRFQTRIWIWWGLYARFLISIICMPLILVPETKFPRQMPLFDVIRYGGLILGRIKAAIRFRMLVL